MGKKRDIPSNATDVRADTTASEELPALMPEERNQRIAEAAYLRAAAREFTGGDTVRDWLEAEAQINASIADNRTKGR